MLSQSRRIPRELFGDLGRTGRSRHSELFTLVYSPFPGPTTPTRFAVSVSKKVARGAVDRNRLRRRGYAALKEVIFDIRPGYKVLLYAKKPLLNASFDEYREDIYSLLGQAQLLISGSARK